MNNKQLYEDTFNSIKMSEEAMKKVKDLSENNKKKLRKAGWRTVSAAAAVVLVFVMGNGLLHAATGSSPIGNFVTLMFGRGNGENQNNMVVGDSEEGTPEPDFYQLEKEDSDENADKDEEDGAKKKGTKDGKSSKSQKNSKSTGNKRPSATEDVDLNNGDADELETDSKILDDEDPSIISKMKTDEEKLESEETEISTAVKEEGGRIYLVVCGESVDITKDFSDGNAEGEVEIKGKTYKYRVSGTVDSNTVMITKE